MRTDVSRSFFDQGVVIPLGLSDLLLGERCALGCRIQAHGLRLFLLPINDLRFEEITQVVQILFFAIISEVIRLALLVDGFTI